MEKKEAHDYDLSKSHAPKDRYNSALNEDELVCRCGKDIPLKGVSQHFNECKEMKTKYTKLFTNIDKLVTNEAESIQDWTNLRVLFKFLEGHMKMMINKEDRKPSHFKAKLEKKSSNKSKASEHRHGNDEEEEEKIDTKIRQNSHFNKMNHPHDVFEEEKYNAIPPEVFRQDSMQRCHQCMKYITPADEREENLVILECADYFHKDCMKQSARRQYLDTQQVKCIK